VIEIHDCINLQVGQTTASVEMAYLLCQVT
jgi:hypothetical protein